MACLKLLNIVCGEVCCLEMLWALNALENGRY